VELEIRKYLQVFYRYFPGEAAAISYHMHIFSNVDAPEKNINLEVTADDLYGIHYMKTD